MFGISFTELLLICAVALMAFGPEKLPDALRWIGRLSGQFRKTSDSLRREVYNSLYAPAAEEISRAQRELSSLRSEFLVAPVLDPNCPDTIAKRSSALETSTQAILAPPTNSAGSTSSLTGSPESGLPQKAPSDTPKPVVVDVSAPSAGPFVSTASSKTDSATTQES